MFIRQEDGRVEISTCNDHSVDSIKMKHKIVYYSKKSKRKKSLLFFFSC